MSAAGSGRWRDSLRGLSRLDRVALAVLALYGLARLVAASGREVPLSGLLAFFFFLSFVYLLIRLFAWARKRLLWSLRNRLVVAYLFIAVVPVLLLVGMAGLSAYVIYSQLGAHLLQDDLQARGETLAATAEAVLSVRVAGGAGRAPGPAASPAIASLLEAARGKLPGLRLEIGRGEEILARAGAQAQGRFVGLVQSGDQLWLQAVASAPTPSGREVVALSVPIAPELLDRLAPDLGPIQFTVTRPRGPERPRGIVLKVGERQFVPVAQIASRSRSLPPARHWLDFEVDGISNLEAVSLEARPEGEARNPVFLSFSARPSQLNQKLFSSLGAFGDLASLMLVVIGVIFLVIEVGALVTGVVLTRTITRAVAELYRATQHVQSADFTHRVRIQQRDQLGALGESFNQMTGSIAGLIEEQRQRQRLENELAIAHQVQSQLFPQSIPSLERLELAAICRAARVVSGDYYDFIQLGPTRLGLVIADISGKGISAALLMASLQAALRSQVLLDGYVWQNTAELVSRLNRHLFLNTSPERYATFFYAVYDSATRVLHYTNAGHLPPLYVVGEQVKKLEEGGMVVGLFDDATYDQGTIQLAPGGLLVAYSDGLVEPENVYGEEFGSKRLVQELLHLRASNPQAVAEALVRAAEDWAGTPEQADDMTVIVARMH